MPNVIIDDDVSNLVQQLSQGVQGGFGRGQILHAATPQPASHLLHTAQFVMCKETGTLLDTFLCTAQLHISVLHDYTFPCTA